MPDLDEGLVKRLAGCNIQDSDVKYKFDALLSLSNVLPEKLVADVVGTFGHLRSSNACGLFTVIQTLRLSKV